MRDDLEKRRLKLLFMLLVLEEESLHTAASFLDRETGGPEFELDMSQLLSEGAIEPLGVRPGMVEELYAVTPTGRQMLRDADFPVKP